MEARHGVPITDGVKLLLNVNPIVLVSEKKRQSKISIVFI